MKNVTVNIAGDVNIIIPAEAETVKESVVGVVELVSADDTPDECFLIDPGANDQPGGYDESDISVLYMVPGKQPEMLELIQALEKMQKYGGCNTVRRVPTYDLLMAYDEDSVIPIGKDEYLFHPTIIFASIAGEVCNIDYEDVKLVKRVMEERTVTLSNGEQDFSAFML